MIAGEIVARRDLGNALDTLDTEPHRAPPVRLRILPYPPSSGRPLPELAIGVVLALRIGPQQGLVVAPG